MAKCPKCKYSFAVPEDEQNMHDCPSCGYSGHEPTKIRYSINLWLTQEIEEGDEIPPSQHQKTAIEKDIIQYLEKLKFGKVDCEIVDHDLVEE